MILKQISLVADNPCQMMGWWMEGGSYLRRKAWVARGAKDTAGGATVLLPRGEEGGGGSQEPRYEPGDIILAWNQ